MALAFSASSHCGPFAGSSIRWSSTSQSDGRGVSKVALNPSQFTFSSSACFGNPCCGGWRYWKIQMMKIQKAIGKHGQVKKPMELEIRGCDRSMDQSEMPLVSNEREEETETTVSQTGRSSTSDNKPASSQEHVLPEGPLSPSLDLISHKNDLPDGRGPSLCIAVIGATGELARNKVFPALFALYYSGFLPENVGIFGYSRKQLTDEDLRNMIAETLTCRVDHHENCGDKWDSFLSRTYHIDGGFNNTVGMAKLNARMEQLEICPSVPHSFFFYQGKSEANRIFYLSVPQEALLDVTSSLAEYSQTHRGWNRVIFEKPFGYNALSSSQLAQFLLSKFEEKQIYRHFDCYGIVRDIVHCHLLQTIALFAMEPPVSLDGDDIRNEKVKVLRSIRKLELDDVVLGQYKASVADKVNVYMDNLTPTFFAAALYIDNARWDGVPFLIKAGVGLIKRRVEIRIQFHSVPGNLYRDRMGHNIDQTTNELILREAPDDAILVKINNKVPGLSLQFDASELNLLYRDKYNVEVPDSYEHLLLDVIDGDNHLFMRSDELEAAWNILMPVLQEIDQNNITPELYQFGGRGPVGSYYLGAKHGVRWADD
ncbi:hypothetical protein QJS04_geneDACA015851 [Acorus gramineus]|uniref:Glucose-6-phosphate dehydrogenase C-terminal domain-containing protein n=1 Tax=Acorus gramineus TaxID=55184 RepID=A0AAV9BRP1_ACOGR|nr:hypothetical protein QJS04_geneDACA015851 [Acorus gramineus]